MKVKFQFISQKREDGWYALLIPSLVIGHFNNDKSVEFGIFWLLWAVGFHIENKEQKGE